MFSSRHMAGHDGDQATATERQLGSEIGSTIWFELYEERSYVLSAQRHFSIKEVDLTYFSLCGFAAP